MLLKLSPESFDVRAQVLVLIRTRRPQTSPEHIVACEDPIRMCCEHTQDRGLRRSEMNVAPGPPHAPMDGSDLQIANPRYGLVRAPSSGGVARPRHHPSRALPGREARDPGVSAAMKSRATGPVRDRPHAGARPWSSTRSAWSTRGSSSTTTIVAPEASCVMRRSWRRQVRAGA